MQRISLLSGVLANRPTPEMVNATWGGAGYGLLYFSTDNSKVYQWSGAAWVDITSSIGGGGGGITLQTNGVANAVQNLLNLIAGTGITLTNVGGGVTIDAVGGGGVPVQLHGRKNLVGPVGVAGHSLVQVDSITVTFPGAGGPWRVLGSYHYWMNGGVGWESGIFDGANWFAQGWVQAQNNNSMLQGTDMSVTTYLNASVHTFATYVYGDGAGTVVTSAGGMGDPARVTDMGPSHMDLSVMASN
jgi:hypothetical protein